MAAPASAGFSPKITKKAQMIDRLASGCKPREQWRIGTEHEKIGFCKDSLKPLPYFGNRSIHAMLTGLQRFGWQPVFEGDNVIALKRDDASVSLEPGGQLELSGAPLEHVHQTCAEVSQHLREVKEVAEMRRVNPSVIS